MICKTVGRSEQQKEEEKEMAEDYRNQAIGVFELESECICFVALDAAAKAAAVKTEVSVQFAGKEYTTERLVEIAKDVWQYDLGNAPEEFKSVELYVKPEESAVYYVINGTTSGSFGI